LNEIRNAVKRLFVDPVQKAALEKEELELQQAFEKLHGEFSGLSGTIKDLRDRIGGHVLHEGVRKALTGMDPGRNALLEVGETIAKTHYRFAGDIALAVMFPEEPEGVVIEKFQDLFEKTAKLVFIVSHIDKIFEAFVAGKRLRNE